MDKDVNEMGALMAGRDLTLVGSFPAALVAGLAPGSCFGEVPGLAAPGGWLGGLKGVFCDALVF